MLNENSIFGIVDKAVAKSFPGNYFFHALRCFNVRTEQDMQELAKVKAIAYQNSKVSETEKSRDIEWLNIFEGLAVTYFSNWADMSRFDNVTTAEVFFELASREVTSTTLSEGFQLPSNWRLECGMRDAQSQGIFSGVVYENSTLVRILPVTTATWISPALTEPFYTINDSTSLNLLLAEFDEYRRKKIAKLALLYDVNMPTVFSFLPENFDGKLCEIQIANETITLAVEMADFSLKRYKNSSALIREQAAATLLQIGTLTALVAFKKVNMKRFGLPFNLILV